MIPAVDIFFTLINYESRINNTIQFDAIVSKNIFLKATEIIKKDKLVKDGAYYKYTQYDESHVTQTPIQADAIGYRLIDLRVGKILVN